MLATAGVSRMVTHMHKEETPMLFPPLLPSPDDLCPSDATPDDPSPDEIQEACQRIRATWSDQERSYRARVRRPAELDERSGRKLSQRN